MLMVKVVRRLVTRNITNLKDLEKILQPIINEVLKETVSEVVKDELESSALEVIHGAGEPIKYPRRSSSNSLGSGGIADKNTMTSNLISDGTLSVSPDADRNREFNDYAGWGYDENNSLAFNLQMGYGNKQYWWNQPRPFVDEARENLKNNKAYLEAMKDGLRAKGLDVV